MNTSPIFTAMTALGQLTMDQLRDYCREHPSRRDNCRWCGRPIVSTPWMSPRGTFHMVTGSWTHEDEAYPCGREFPYRFAEPPQEDPG